MNIDIFRPIKFGKETFHAKFYDENSFVMDWKVESGGKVPAHVHQYMDEHFKVTEGELEFEMNGKKVIKKSGEEFFIPKNTIHSVGNAIKAQSAATVTYSPCADTHKMFMILASLDAEKPGSMVNMIKYFYLAPKLGLKEFSSVRPVFLMKVMSGIAGLMGSLSGWKKLVDRFNGI